MKKQLSKNRLYQLLTIFIATFLFSITFWEYCLDERRVLPLIVAILSTTAFLVNFVALFITKNFRKTIFVFLSLYFLIIIFDIFAFTLKKNKNKTFKTEFDTYTDLQNRGNVEYDLLDSIVTDQQIAFVFGKKEVNAQSKYKPLSFFYSGDRDTILLKLFPEWFFHYVDIVDPVKTDHNVFYYGRRFSNFLTWLYPKQVFNVPIFDSETHEQIKIVYSRRTDYNPRGFNDEELILLPKPLFRQLLREREDLILRFHTYVNIIKYTFNSPFVKSPVKYPHILKKETITTADLDSLGLNAKQKKLMLPYVK